MKRLILFICLLASSHLLTAQGIEFFQGTWAEAKAKAKETGKLVFVDAYTTWCGPCKMMAKNIFPLKEVGDYYNANFVNFKIDMEKGEGPAFGKQYKIRAYPTFLFIDGEGKLVFEKVGGSDGKGFVELGKTAVGKYDQSPAFAARYDQGDRSSDLIYFYIRALNQAGKPSLKIANDYLSQTNDRNSEYYYKIIYESTLQSDSKPFEFFVKEEKNIAKVLEPQLVQRRKYNALINTAKKANEFQTPELANEANNSARKYLDKKQYKLFTIESAYHKAAYDRNDTELYKSIEELADNLYENNPVDVISMLNMLKTKGGDEKARKATRALYNGYANASNNPKVRLDYAMYLLSINEGKEALTQAEKAKSDSSKMGLDTTDYDNAILFIKSKV